VFALFSRSVTLRTDLSFQPTRGEGPVGTGVHLLRVTEAPAGTATAEAWVTLLFLPLFPLGTWAVDRRKEPKPLWHITGVSRPLPARSLLWVAGGAAYVLLSLVPASCAITLFIGSQAAGLGCLFCSVAAIVGALGWLDLTRERVPLRVALQALSSTFGTAEDALRE